MVLCGLPQALRHSDLLLVKDVVTSNVDSEPSLSNVLLLLRQPFCGSWVVWKEEYCSHGNGDRGQSFDDLDVDLAPCFACK